ncbi:hypothetical protein DLM75_22215 [Leptospira stimsonii]|uniref:Uncharacterized protein n=1 Tax=Leptospira stimsonii TaxID=2202203 RepID=A0A396YNF9_9LEPT|nr:hypothetical protein DLM75_22215 [Leptospira stimsonii]
MNVISLSRWRERENRIYLFRQYSIENTECFDSKLKKGHSLFQGGKLVNLTNEFYDSDSFLGEIA